MRYVVVIVVGVDGGEVGVVIGKEDGDDSLGGGGVGFGLGQPWLQVITWVVVIVLVPVTGIVTFDVPLVDVVYETGIVISHPRIAHPDNQQGVTYQDR